MKNAYIVIVVTLLVFVFWFSKTIPMGGSAGIPETKSIPVETDHSASAQQRQFEGRAVELNPISSDSALVLKWKEKLANFERSRVAFRGSSVKSLSDSNAEELRNKFSRRVQVVITAPTAEAIRSMREEMKDDFLTPNALSQASSILNTEARYFNFTQPYRIVEVVQIEDADGKTDGPTVSVIEASSLVEDTNSDNSVVYTAAGAINSSRKVSATYQIDDSLLFQ